MNSLDLLLLVLLFGYAGSGWVQGFVTNLTGMIGLIVGGVIAVTGAPWVLPDETPTLQRSLLALVLVVGCAAIGQAAGTFVGSSLRSASRGRSVRLADSVAGAGLGMAVVLVASWALGGAVTAASVPYLSSAARNSTILAGVDAVMPDRARESLRALEDLVDTTVFPRYLDPFESEQTTPIGPPDRATLNRPGVRTARDSVVKVTGVAECQRGVEGSGFVYARGRVMTNAHVVAGVDEPMVELAGRRSPARVVLFDPDLDVAVLAVDGLRADPLSFGAAAQPGDDVAILGYPQNGPFDARAGRIRSRRTLSSPDIYERGQARRETYAVRGLVRSGNSGGPLVDADGAVVGVIFAASLSDDATGYALTAAQVATNADAGTAASEPVDTGGCT